MGYQALQTRFETNHRERNELAFMAYKFKDRSVAEQQFASIGNDWSRGRVERPKLLREDSRLVDGPPGLAVKLRAFRGGGDCGCSITPGGSS